MRKMRDCSPFIRVVAIVLFILFLGTVYITVRVTKESRQQIESLALDKQLLTKHWQAEIVKTDSLQKSLNSCLGILSPEDSLRLQVKNLQKEVARLKKKVVATPPAPKKEDVAVSTFDQPFKRSEGTPKPLVVEPIKRDQTVNEEPVTRSLAPLNNYESIYGGDFGTTVNEQGYLTYYVSQSLVDGATETPRLNGQSGPQFSYNQEIGYWTLLDNRVIPAEQIEAKLVIRWNVYIGLAQPDLGSYPMYIPHESLKSFIRSARGQEYGEITPEDLQKMGKNNEQIARGLIKPLVLNDKPGRNNQNFWHGWNFNTPVTAKVK